jgi:hypothetical protein
MADSSLWIPEILPEVPGCNDLAIERAVNRAANILCSKARLWLYFDEDTLGEGEFSIELLNKPTSSHVVAIDQVEWAGVQLEPKDTRWLDEHAYGWRDGRLEGSPQYYSQLATDTLVLVPCEPGTVRYWLYVTPTIDARSLPDFLWNDYREEVRIGALSSLLMMGGKSWTNPQLSESLRVRFENDVAKATRRRTMGHQRAPVRTKPSFF